MFYKTEQDTNAVNPDLLIKWHSQLPNYLSGNRNRRPNSANTKTPVFTRCGASWT